MKGYKCSPARLARFFLGSRDRWKARAVQYYQKVRALQITVRDLKRSRDHWKKRARQSENQSRQEETASSESGLSEGERHPRKENTDSIIQESRPTPSLPEEVKEGEFIPYNALSPCLSETAWPIPYGHVYPVFVIQLAIEQPVNSFVSARGCQHTLEAFARHFHFPVPSFTTLRYWWLRLGLYELQRPIEKRTDWIILVDMTIGSGKSKCLLVVGIPQARLPIAISSSEAESTTYALRHHDVELLALEVMDHPTGKAVYQCLETLSEKTGVVRQILADHGSDIQKGINLYQEKHQDTIYTYDVTHKMALLLKHELKDDKRFQAFREQCTTTLREVQQTDLYCLKPPTQRVKARYHNIDTYVKWAQAILRYQESGDFSEFGTRFIMDARTFDLAWRILDGSFRKTLCGIPWNTDSTREAFIHHVIIPLGDRLSELQRELICHAADEGKRRFEEKLGWVIDYREEIRLYSQFIDIVNSVEKQVKYQGLNQASGTLFKERMQDLILLPRAQHLKEQVMDYLREEGDKIPDGQTLLGTSDVLESIIGKFKIFLEKSPLREISQIVLSIPLFTIRIVEKLVKTAMETIREIDVDDWAKRTLGKSALAKRRALLGTKKKGNRSRMKTGGRHRIK